MTAEYSKAAPDQLRSKSNIAAANAHQDLGVSRSPADLAGPSRTTSTSTFRTPAESTSSQAEAQFHAFASGTHQHHPPWNLGAQKSFRNQPDHATETRDPLTEDSKGKGKARDAATVSSTTWTPSDLQPRLADGHAILSILNERTAPEDLEQVLADLDASRREPWRERMDNAIPQDPNVDNNNHQGSYYSAEDFPFIHNLLQLPSEQAMAEYLSTHRYTDDVWGLPETLREDLENARHSTAGSALGANQDAALRRLMLLKRHLTGRTSVPVAHKEHRSDPPMTPGQAPRQNEQKPALSFSDIDWARIWQS